MTARYRTVVAAGSQAVCMSFQRPELATIRAEKKAYTLGAALSKRPSRLLLLVTTQSVCLIEAAAGCLGLD